MTSIDGAPASIRLQGVRVAVMGLGLLFSAAQPAVAQQSGSFTSDIKARHSGKCIDAVNGQSGNGAPIQQYSCRDSASDQKYVFTPVAGASSTYTLKNVKSGTCLDVSTSRTLSGKPKAAIAYLWSCHGRANQQFRLEPAGNDYRLRAAHNGSCLDVNQRSTDNGASIIAYPCTGGTNQQFSVNTGGAAPAPQPTPRPEPDPAPEPSAAGSTLPPAPSGFRWVADNAVTDDFNGNRLDSSKWLNDHPSWNGRLPSQFMPENVSVSGGLLRLKSTSRVNSLNEVRNHNSEHWVDSAAVTSKKRLRFGYYEARIKNSRISMTSAFWFGRGDGIEIDVTENFGAHAKNPNRNNKMLMNTHYFVNGWPNDRKTPREYELPTNVADRFYTFGVWWKDADNIIFYVDGREAARVKTGGPFKTDLTMIFDTEAFDFAGFPTVASLRDNSRNTMLVDWVKGWKLIRR